MLQNFFRFFKSPAEEFGDIMMTYACIVFFIRSYGRILSHNRVYFTCDPVNDVSLYVSNIHWFT